jgi:hypothetical protein
LCDKYQLLAINAKREDLAQELLKKKSKYQDELLSIPALTLRREDFGSSFNAGSSIDQKSISHIMK